MSAFVLSVYSGFFMTTAQFLLKATKRETNCFGSHLETFKGLLFQ